MLLKLKRYKNKQNFNPDFLGLFSNPFYLARRDLYKNIKKLSKNLNGVILDVGCGSKPYEELFSCTKYVGIDIEASGHDHSNSKVDAFYDGHIFPFQDNHFDNIITNQVLEHVFNPIEFLSEINRVLKFNGYLLLTVPFVWDEHEKPYDYARYSSFGLRHLLEQHGFEIIYSIKTLNNISILFQLLNAYLYKIMISKIPFLSWIISSPLVGSINLLAIFLKLITPKNDDLYLDNIVLACKRPNRNA